METAPLGGDVEKPPAQCGVEVLKGMVFQEHADLRDLC